MNPFTAVYKCTLYARENKVILMLLCDVSYSFIQNHNYWRDPHQIWDWRIGHDFYHEYHYPEAFSI